MPTLLLVPPDSPMGPRQEAAHNDLVRMVVVPVRATASAASNPPGILRAVDEFLAEVARA